MKNLVIVESPTKAKTIGRFLGDKYEIIASMGHIMDLPKSKLGIEVDNGFKPDYQMMADKKKVISQLKSASKNAESIILATDPDREGEAIASHVKDVLFKDKDKKFIRIVFHEITKEAVEEALKNPRVVDENLVDAQTARRVLDRLVGYKISPILWSKVRRGLSAGRVQSVALRLIVERERAIERFKKEKYYTVDATLSNLKGNEAKFELVEIDGKKLEFQETLELYVGSYSVTKTIISTQEEANNIVKLLSKEEFKVSDVIRRQARRSSGPPLTTSTLQQEASRRFGLSGKRTMSLAQKLYEEGFITYHRTDSVIIGNAAVASIRNFVEKNYGKNYIPEKPKFYKTKSKVAQEAHEAIRPTNVSVDYDKASSVLGKDYARIYDIIWKRAVASQMSDAIVEQSSVIVDTKDPSSNEAGNKYKFKANGSVLIFDGFLKVNQQALNDNLLPDFVSGEILTSKNTEAIEHETQAPPRYNDASLIAMLEEKGIGRPSTYATIISTIESRQYIERVEGRFHPTNVGIAVNDFLVSNFSTIDDIPFTALMEDELDDIANGEKKWVPVIKEFYTPFEKNLEGVKNSARVKIEVEKTDEICPQDGGHLVIRIGRFGKFMACENFPACKFTKPFVQETNLICPKDGGKIILKKTKKGRKFYGCSNYPKCDFASWTKPTSGQVEQSETPDGKDIKPLKGAGQSD